MATDTRVALVTGGARGIGFACVRRFLRDGYCVAIVDINTRALARAQEELHGLVGEARVLLAEASVTDRSGVAGVVEQILGRWGRLDVLVNDAGLGRPAGGPEGMAEADWDAVVEVNLGGAYDCSAAAVPAMRKGGGGAIVMMGSIAAGGHGTSPAYAAAKAGLIGLARHLAVELGPENIRVNVVAPGTTLTEWVRRSLPPEQIERSAATTPLRRNAEPEDIAAAVAFFASDDARHVTGQVLSVSGGIWMP